jgi:hypothetical protein
MARKRQALVRQLLDTQRYHSSLVPTRLDGRLAPTLIGEMCYGSPSVRVPRIAVERHSTCHRFASTGPIRTGTAQRRRYRRCKSQGAKNP